MLQEKLKQYKIILASGSPRRQHFFKELGIDFTIDVRPVDETYSTKLKGSEITDYLSKLKASLFTDLNDTELVITSDTIVWMDDQAIEKPKDHEDATRMLARLSGKMHEVFTSVCFTSANFQIVLNDCTKVWFKQLTSEEIEYYVSNYKPFDKAGAYGIQDWLGYIGIARLEGSYFNVMGLPTRLVYKTLLDISDGKYR